MNYGKSLCILCDKLLARAGMIAHPCDCPTHHFHCECLVKHARKHQQRQCPIDQIPFEFVVCEGGLVITFQKTEHQNKPNADPAPTKTSQPPKEDGNQDLPTDRSNTPNWPQSACKITIERENPSGQSDVDDLVTSTLNSVLQNTGGNADGLMTCTLCGKPIEATDMTSPNCCMHYFHEKCLDDYTDKNDLCPFEGCYREIESFITAVGDHYAIRVSEIRDYRNMINAPEHFICHVCNRPDLQLNRATAKPCGHILHRSCLIEYIRQHKQCPICKENTSVVECDRAGLLFFP